MGIPQLAILRPLFAQGDPSPADRPGGADPSTPVRTGGPVVDEPDARDVTFDPCSHRGTRGGFHRNPAEALRPLFAQGDHAGANLAQPVIPSTPVRTGGPVAGLPPSQPKGFDPCSHRGTSSRLRRAVSPTLRPLFAQGVFLHNIFVTGNPAFMRLLRPHFSGLTSKLS